MRTVDLGNNESRSIGVAPSGDGFIALTLSQSKRFKTRGGAERWLARRGYAPDGSRLPDPSWLDRLDLNDEPTRPALSIVR